MRCLAIIASILVSVQLTAQQLPKKIQFQSLPIHEFANHSVVNDFLQDPHGLMWVACNGIQRYDGYKFSEISQHQNETFLNLRGREVNKLLWDTRGNRLLITTRNYGLISYSYETNRLTPISKETGGGILRDMAQDNDGTVWIITAEKGVFTFKNNELQLHTQLSYTIKSPSALIKYDDQLIFGDVNKVFFLRNGSLSDTLLLKKIHPELSVNTRVTALRVDNAKNLWIGTEKNGVIVYNLNQKKVVKIFSPFNTPLFNRIEKIIQDSSGLIWIITKANGLIIYSPEKDDFKHVRQLSFRSGSNSVGTCNAIMEDNSGVIWVGSIGEVRKYDPSQLPFEHYVYDPENEKTLSDNMTRGISEDRHGKIWITTEGGYLNRFDRKTNDIERIRVTIPGETEHLTAYSVAELTTPGNYLLTTNRGIVEFNYASKRFAYYEPLKKISHGLPNRQMLLHRDTLWVVSYARLLMHVLKTKETKVYTDFQYPENIRGSNNITCIGVDHLNRKWIGTNSGISRFEPKQEKFTYRSLSLQPKKDSTSVMILSIESIRKELWVGTFQHGLFRFDLSNDDNTPPQHLSIADGLPDNTIYGCLASDTGPVWISCNTGLFTYDVTTKNLVRYGTADGIQENEFNRLTYLKSSTGEFYFGGINGFNVFNPKDIILPKLFIQPKILHVKVMNDPEDRDHHLVMFPEFPENQKLDLPYRDNSVEIKFYVPIYLHSAHYKIVTMLEGVDKEWKTPTDNIVTYYNLRPAQYRFIVKTIDHSGQEFTSSMMINIDRPLWSTWWFITLMVLLVLFIIIGITAWRSRRIFIENKKLAILLSIKSKEIMESKTELESLNQKKDLIFSILSHDLRSPLTTLKGFLGLLIDNDTMDRQEVKKHATNIRHSVTNALDLIDNTLYWSLSQMGNITYDPSPVNLYQLFEKIKGLYSLTAEKKQIRLELQCDPELMLWVDENMIYVALRNFVSNALKFTSEGKRVTVLAQQEGDMAHITVKDEGIGMTEEERQRIINSDISFIKRGTSSEKGTGIGLSLCKKFIELNKGTLEIMSTEHKGSVFIIVLPVAINQPSDSIPEPLA